MINYRRMEKELDRAMLKDDIKFYSLMTVCVVALVVDVIAWGTWIWIWLKL